MATATCKRRCAGSYEYRGRRIDKTPSDAYGDNVWHISTINGDPIDVADTLREAKAMVDRMGPLTIDDECNVYRNGSQVELVGWAGPNMDGNECDCYHIADYFDSDGMYRGPDQHGTYPVFM